MNICKVYEGNVKAVNEFSIDIADKEFIVLVGPSGCGKSTVLRIIAGLEEITSGELYIDNKLMNSSLPKDRDIAMVFQNYALYPHMTVYENMAYGLKIRKIHKEEIKRRVKEVSEILGLNEYLSRKPRQLSGGQRQRVALGRAIVREPKVFLFDEPLSNLDAILRTQMRAELIKLHQKLQTTFIYVTHDQVEAMTMGTRIVVMNEGFIQQIDSPQNVYTYPQSKFVAEFIGSPKMNFFEAYLKKRENFIEAIFGNGIIKLPLSIIERIKESFNSYEKKICLGIRPEDFIIGKEKSIMNFDVRVEVIELLGVEKNIYVEVIDNTIYKTNFIIKTYYENDICINQILHVSINPQKIYIFDIENGNSLLNYN